jgi:hypothetical protein
MRGWEGRSCQTQTAWTLFFLLIIVNIKPDIYLPLSFVSQFIDSCALLD